MKKLLALSLVLSVACSLSAQRIVQDPDSVGIGVVWEGNATMIADSDAPTIDGVVDDIWTSSGAEMNDITSYSPFGDAVPPANLDDISGTFWALWDSTGIYFLIEAKDDILINTAGNALEIYTSVQYTRLFGEWANPGYGLSDYQLIMPLELAPTINLGLYSAQEYYSDDGLTVSSSTPDAAFVFGDAGYVAEVYLPWDAIGGMPVYETADGVPYMGLEVMLQDEDDGADRDTKMAWATIEDVAWASTQDWGTLYLLSGDTPPPAATPIWSPERDPAPTQNYTLTGLWWETEAGAYWVDLYPFVYEYTRGWEFIFDDGATNDFYFGYNYTTAEFFVYFAQPEFDLDESGFAGNIYYTTTDGTNWTPQEFEGVWYHKAPAQ